MSWSRSIFKMSMLGHFLALKFCMIGLDQVWGMMLPLQLFKDCRYWPKIWWVMHSITKQIYVQITRFGQFLCIPSNFEIICISLMLAGQACHHYLDVFVILLWMYSNIHLKWLLIPFVTREIFFLQTSVITSITDLCQTAIFLVVYAIYMHTDITDNEGLM